MTRIQREIMSLLDRPETRWGPWVMGHEMPLTAIKREMARRGLTRKDMEPMIGSRGRVSEVLNGKRKLSLEMIRRLHEQLRIPAHVLIKDYPTEETKSPVSK